MGVVAAVIPCFNRAGFLEEAIASARSQTLPPEVVIVVDDGSTDGSPEVAERAGAHVIRAERRKGPGAARNLGVAHAGTEFVAFLDADDAWLPHHCATLVDLFRRTPNAALTFGRIQRFGETGDRPTPRRTPILQEAALPELLADNPIPTSAVLADRGKLLSVGGFREDLRYAEDYDLWLRLAEQYALVGADVVTCRYREHPEQVSSAGASMIRMGWQARLAAKQRLTEMGRYDPTHVGMMELALHENVVRAWHHGDRALLTELLGLAEQLETRPQVARAIRTRLRTLPFRRVAQAALTAGRTLLGRN